MKKMDNIIGGVGLVLTIGTLIWYSITRLWEIYHWILIVLGAAGIGYFIFVYIKNRKAEFSSRSLKQGSNVLVQVIVFVAIVAMIAFITTRRHYRADLTKNNLYSLSDQTDKVVSGLKKDVDIKAFFKSSDQNVATDLLDEYAYRSDKLKYELIDPDEEPAIRKKYGITSYNSLVVESGAKKEMITDMNETNLTNAIIKVTREQDKVIYFSTGHGERLVSDKSAEGLSTAADAIKNENHLVREINLAVQGSIPDSCTVLVIASPTTDFFPTELDTIKSFLDNGGKALIMFDPDRGGNLHNFVQNYKVTVGNDMIIEPSAISQLFGGGPAVPIVQNYDKNHAITKDFGVMTFFPYASSVTPEQDKGGYNITTLLKTGKNSWAETDYSTGKVGFDENQDTPGPVGIDVIVEKDVPAGKMALDIFGDSDFATNAYFKQQGNGNLFLNTINYLAEEEDLISIRPKQVDDSRLTLTQADVSTLFYLVVITIPLLVVILGVVIFFRRNRA
ncbi:MAG: GldG family protein [Calditrichaceae bacterium]